MAQHVWWVIVSPAAHATPVQARVSKSARVTRPAAAARRRARRRGSSRRRRAHAAAAARCRWPRRRRRAATRRSCRSAKQSRPSAACFISRHAPTYFTGRHRTIVTHRPSTVYARRSVGGQTRTPARLFIGRPSNVLLHTGRPPSHVIHTPAARRRRGVSLAGRGQMTARACHTSAVARWIDTAAASLAGRARTAARGACVCEMPPAALSPSRVCTRSELASPPRADSLCRGMASLNRAELDRTRLHEALGPPLYTT